MSIVKNFVGFIKHKFLGGMEKHRDFIESSRKSAFSLRTSKGDTFSQFGGIPNLPTELEWPIWNGERLSFLCQLAMEEIPEGQLRNTLPPTGILFFFYDDKQTSWGFDPEDKGSWRVLYTPKSGDDLKGESSAVSSEEPLFTKKEIEFVPVETYPNCEDEHIDILNLSEQNLKEHFELCESAYDYRPKHQLLGFPLPEQANDMRFESQLASQGIFMGGTKPDDEERAKEIYIDYPNWILLLQVDSDVDCRMQWGDLGKLYFWIKKDDLANCQFENCWMILQCG